MKLQKLKHFLGAAIVITTPCTNNLEVKAMTNESSQEAIKVIYQDEFFSRPENRHRRDDLIKKILESQNELEGHIPIKKAPHSAGLLKLIT